uniref:Uncharacterized protein n=1 Tax=Rhizophora mucronata TaxID=61149 RepID=A0A2P2Q213_RHIMU
MNVGSDCCVTSCRKRIGLSLNCEEGWVMDTCRAVEPEVLPGFLISNRSRSAAKKFKAKFLQKLIFC